MSMPVALTIGDAAGIGPEIVVKLHAQGLPAACVVYGDLGALTRAARMLGSAVQCIAIATLQDIPADPRPGVLYVRPTHPSRPEDLPLGRVDARAGSAAVAVPRDAAAGRSGWPMSNVQSLAMP